MLSAEVCAIDSPQADASVNRISLLMEWYYGVGEQREGPVTIEQLRELRQRGEIRDNTLVWRQGMTDWAPYSTATANSEPGAATSVVVGDRVISASEKERFAQQLREGADREEAQYFDYGGFWRRAVASFIDSLVLNTVFYGVGFILMGASVFDPMLMEDPDAASMLFLPYFLFSVTVTILYYTLLTGNPKLQATLGKRLLGMKVVTPDGRGISYARALGRYFATIPSAMLFCIGFLMVAFDSKKRGLHDRLAGTLVVKR